MIFVYRDFKEGRTRAISEQGNMIMEFESLPTLELDEHEVREFMSAAHHAYRWIGWNDVNSYAPLRRALDIYKLKQNRKS